MTRKLIEQILNIILEVNIIYNNNLRTDQTPFPKIHKEVQKNIKEGTGISSISSATQGESTSIPGRLRGCSTTSMAKDRTESGTPC